MLIVYDGCRHASPFRHSHALFSREDHLDGLGNPDPGAHQAVGHLLDTRGGDGGVVAAQPCAQLTLFLRTNAPQQCHSASMRDAYCILRCHDCEAEQPPPSESHSSSSHSQLVRWGISKRDSQQRNGQRPNSHSAGFRQMPMPMAAPQHEMMLDRAESRGGNGVVIMHGPRRC